MSSLSQTIQDKCLAFSDRIIKLNDYLLEQAASSMSDGRSKKYQVPVDYASTVYCGMHNGLIPSSARKTADAFVRAQSRLFVVERDTDYAFLKTMMEKNHDD